MLSILIGLFGLWGEKNITHHCSFTGRMEGKKEDIERVEGKKEKETIEGDDNVVLQIIIVESWLPFRILMESLYFCVLFIFFSGRLLWTRPSIQSMPVHAIRL